MSTAENMRDAITPRSYLTASTPLALFSFPTSCLFAASAKTLVAHLRLPEAHPKIF